MWFTPYREQAGAQKGRCCTEHIVTLRILTDLARKTKKKLFITFIDFNKACDLVPRHILMRILRRLGCGAVMLGIIGAMYSITESVIGSVVFAATIGVRQGSPTSCLLFLVYVNDLIRLIKDNCRDCHAVLPCLTTPPPPSPPPLVAFIVLPRSTYLSMMMM